MTAHLASEEFGIYLKIAPDSTVDFKTISTLLGAIDSAVSEISFVLDPQTEVNIGLRAGEEGSLDLRSIIRLASPSRDDLKSAAKTLATVILTLIGQNYANDFIDLFQAHVNGTETETETLQNLTIDELKEILREVERNESVRQYRREMYKALDEDQAVTAIGAYRGPKRPEQLPLIPRQHFAELWTPPSEPEAEQEKTRSSTKQVDLLVISPVLSDKKGRRWKFALDGFEFGAPVEDTEFTISLNSGTVEVPMRMGVIMTADLRIDETWNGTNWEISNRTVERVISIIAPPSQGRLDLSGEEQHE
jgi:hypothetical protein